MTCIETSPTAANQLKQYNFTKTSKHWFNGRKLYISTTRRHSTTSKKFAKSDSKTKYPLCLNSSNYTSGHERV